MTDRALPRAVLAAGLCGQVSATVAGVLPVLTLPVAAAALVVLAHLAGAAGTRTRVPARRAANAVVLVLSVVAALRLSGGAEDGARDVLGPLLVAVHAVHAATWHTRRDLQTGVLAATGLLVLAASYAPDVLVGLPLLAGWVACVLAGLLLVRARAVEGVDVVAPGRTAPLWPAVALAVVLGLVAFLLVPVPDGAGLRSRVAPGPGAASGRPASLSADRMDMRVRGALSDRPIALVPSDSPARWRSTVHDTYDGTSWYTASPQRERVAGPPYVLASAPGTVRTDDVRLEQRTGSVWAPGVALRVDGSGAGPGVTDGAGTLRVQPRGGSYRVTTAVQESDPAALRGAALGGPADPRDLQLPAALPERVRALGVQLTAGAATRYDAVLAVEQWVQGRARYQLDSPVPLPGEDAVDRFLFVDRVGFCEQFAAAEVVLLRAAGIPARLVTGLAHGTERGDGRRTFTERNLHAWVEVPYGPMGWAASDPTAVAAREHGEGLRSRVAARVAAALRSLDGVPGGRAGLALVLVVVAAVAPVLVRRRRGVAGTDAPAPSAAPAAGPLLAAFLRLDDRLADRRRRPAETLGEMHVRLGLSAVPGEAFRAVERECYAEDPPAAPAAVEVLDRL